MENVINFLNKVGKINNSFDIKKAKKSIESCQFENLKKKEQVEGFIESPVGQKTGKKLAFFNLGKDNNWKKILPKNIKSEMDKIFKEDLMRWGYNIEN